MANGKDERYNSSRSVGKNVQCEHCLEPYYSRMSVNNELMGSSSCPSCGEDTISTFDDNRNEKRLSRDAYDTRETEKG